MTGSIRLEWQRPESWQNRKIVLSDLVERHEFRAITVVRDGMPVLAERQLDAVKLRPAQGPEDMRTFYNASLAAAAIAAATALTAVPLRAQEMSQKSIETLMDYAWAITPDRFTKPNGVTVEIDRANRKVVEVPVETARDIIRVGRLSAHAQVCDLKEEHAINYRTMMAREAVKKKWSEQQMVYINQLHLVTVMLLTGKLKLIEGEEGKEPVVEESIGKTVTCPDEQKKKVQDAVSAYLKSGPQLDTASNNPPPQGAPGPAVAPAATPTSAPAPAKAAPKK